MSDENLQKLFIAIDESLKEANFIKLTLSGRKVAEAELKNVYARLVTIKAGTRLSLVYRYATRDVTRNFTFSEGVEEIQKQLVYGFNQAILLTSNADIHFMVLSPTKSTLKTKAASQALTPVFMHDKQKSRLINVQNNPYLTPLGISTAEGKIKKGSEDKFRQINKYIEEVSHIVEQAGFEGQFSIADMGSGKGYLTFALYDYLSHASGYTPTITGIELRQGLVDQCNDIAHKAGYASLKFIQGTIESADLPNIDMLIALHACDTATDEAIFRGISQKARVIVTAPCCHKQIRQQMNAQEVLGEITKFGILKERQAEIVTDTIRALILEAYGYSARVFEFISTEHTPKNVMIAAVRKKEFTSVDEAKLTQIEALKSLFGIEFHYLEKLLKLTK